MQNSQKKNIRRNSTVLGLISILFNMLALEAAAQPADFNVIEKNYGHDYLQGYKFEQQGKYAEALAAFSRSIGAHPENTPVYLERADTLIHLKRYREALSDLNKYSSMIDQTSEKNEKSRQAVIARYKAKTLDGLGQSKEALKKYKESLALEDSVYTHVELGNYYKNHGDRGAASRHFQIAKSQMHGGGWYADWGQFEIDLDNSMKELEVTATKKSLNAGAKQKQ